MANGDIGEVITFKKPLKRELSLSPDIKEVPIPNDILSRNNISNKNNIPNNTTPKSIPDNTSPSDMKQVVDSLNKTNTILGDIRRNATVGSVSHTSGYNATTTIPIASPNQIPFDQVTNAAGTTIGYTQERINNVTGRNAKRVIIKNMGPGDLYVIYSSTGNNDFASTEVLIQEGDTSAFYNVYEIRTRSPTAGLVYATTETELPLATTTVTRAEKIETYSTTSTTDFTAACAINAMITLNLNPPLLSNKYTIRGVNIQSIQQIDFDLLFFGSNVFATAGVLDTDTFLDSVELDMTQFPAFQINSANQWKLSVSNLNILYEDANQSNTLHVALLNLGPVAKIAGALGGVQIDFKMTPRA